MMTRPRRRSAPLSRGFMQRLWNSSEKARRKSFAETRSPLAQACACNRHRSGARALPGVRSGPSLVHARRDGIEVENRINSPMLNLFPLCRFSG
ncbi:hypothetical protein [Burkholderia sp. S-53]|uniref:hypothetical protein n=1 Tax=Burkholderia sp. S-53 TaxID=2906514 RepID=UPI0021CF3C06|nr:hypothetical protein [Burkholderia sp. S-53]UXU86313.1 hypothetical protein LXM88_14090 [Burkholderia sp. S-53]